MPSFVNAERRDARTLVFTALSEKWPLSAKQVFSSIKGVPKPPTYQGVHKALRQLEKEDVVEKTVKGYSLSKPWLSKTSDALNALKSKYDASEAAFEGNVLNLSFDNASNVDDFLIAFAKKLHATKRDLLVLQWNHFWIPLFFPRQVYVEMKEFFESCDAYAVTPSNTPVDQWCAALWEKAGLRKRLGVKSKYSSDVIAVRDIVIQVFYPRKLLEEIDEEYRSVKDIRKFDADRFFQKVFMQPTKIPVVVLRNAALAEQIKKDVLVNFR